MFNTVQLQRHLLINILAVDMHLYQVTMEIIIGLFIQLEKM